MNMLFAVLVVTIWLIANINAYIPGKLIYILNVVYVTSVLYKLVHLI